MVDYNSFINLETLMEKGNLLLVEDDVLILEYLEEIFKEYADEVFTATTGEVALNFLFEKV